MTLPAEPSPPADPQAPPPRPAWARALWTAAGLVFLLLGALGIPLPLLPTTPFLLLATACFLRGSPRLHAWVLNNRVFGQYVRDYRAGRGVPLGAKVATLALLWASMGFSVGFLLDSLALKIVLLTVAVAVTIHILMVSTRPRK